MGLPQVKTRTLVIGEPWEITVRARDIDVTGDTFSAKLSTVAADVVLATAVVTKALDGADTLITVYLGPTATAALKPGQAKWGFKRTNTLFTGFVKVVKSPATVA